MFHSAEIPTIQISLYEDYKSNIGRRGRAGSRADFVEKGAFELIFKVASGEVLQVYQGSPEKPEPIDVYLKVKTYFKELADVIVEIWQVQNL